MKPIDGRHAEEPLEEFLERVRPRIRTIFLRYRIPQQDTEDLLQQALLAFIYRRHTIRDADAWLTGTLRNKCLLYWRDRRRKLYEVVDATVLEHVAKPLAPSQEEADLHRDLDTLLEDLPERCRNLLLLRYREGYEPDELAQELGYSQASISKVTTRCLAALTRRLVVSGMGEKKTDEDD